MSAQNNGCCLNFRAAVPGATWQNLLISQDNYSRRVKSLASYAQIRRHGGAQRQGLISWFSTLLFIVPILFTPLGIGAQTPDLRSMSGIPLPMADMPAGSASVRVVRGNTDHPVPGIEVILHPTQGGQQRHRLTDEKGRALFQDLGDAEYVARVTLDGVKLTSEPFRTQPKGVRLLLVAPPPQVRSPSVPTLPTESRPKEKSGDPHVLPTLPPPAASQPQSPSTSLPTTPLAGGYEYLSIAPGSEIVMDFVEDMVRIREILLVRNDGPPLDPGPRGLRIPLPQEAQDVSLPEGTRFKLSEEGEIVILGPIPPGETRVAVQYFVPMGQRAALTIRIPIPFRADDILFGHRQTSLNLEISGSLRRSLLETQEAGPFIVHKLAPLLQGSSVTVTLKRSRYVETTAFLIGVCLFGWLLVAAWHGGPSSRRTRLLAQREHLLGEIIALEKTHAVGKAETRWKKEQREQLITELEKIDRDLHMLGWNPAEHHKA